MEEKKEDVIGSVLGGIFGFFGIQSEEDKKAELIQMGTELQKQHESIAGLYINIEEIKNKQKLLEEKIHQLRKNREEKQRKNYLEANKKRISKLKVINYITLFGASLIGSLFFFRILTINNGLLFIVLIFSFFILASLSLLPVEKKLIELPNDEEQKLQREKEKNTIDLLAKQELISSFKSDFLENQEKFLDKIELINPESADELIKKVLEKILKPIFADNPSSINLKYLREKRLYLKELRLQREQKEKIERREQKEKEKAERTVYNNPSSNNNSWQKNNKEVNVKGYYRKDGTYVKAYKRGK